MKLRFSLRLLLLLVVPAVAALAFFYHLRKKPEAIAREFQNAIQSQNKHAAARLLSTAELESAIASQSPHKYQWELQSFDFAPQTTGQWLRGFCPGTLLIDTGFRFEREDSILSGSQTGTCEVVATADGIQIVAVVLESPTLGITPKPPYGAPNANGTP